MSRPQLPDSIDVKTVQCLATYVNVVLKTCRFLFFFFREWNHFPFPTVFFRGNTNISPRLLVFDINWNHSNVKQQLSTCFQWQSVKITCRQQRMWHLSLFFQLPTFFDCFCESPILRPSRSLSHGFVSATVSATLRWESHTVSVRHTIPSRQTKFHNKGEETAFAVNHPLIRKWLCQKKKSADMHHRHAHVETRAMTRRTIHQNLITKFGITTWARGNKSWMWWILQL